jgi:hypothetical protein
MELKEIINKLEYYDGTFPRQALQEAIEKKELVTPVLLQVLAQPPAFIDTLPRSKDYITHVYAMYLSAQFREKRAYPLLIDFFSTPGEIALDITGDVVTEDLDRILASVSCGDDSLIKQLAEKEDANEYVRNAALRALVCLVAAGEKSREEVMEYYKGLFQSDNVSREPSHFWSGLISCCTDLYPEEVYPEIQQAFNDELVDRFFIGIDDVDRKLSKGKESALAQLKNENYRLIGDTIKEIEWWASFQSSSPPKQPVAQKKKIGRNEPCPCGSGKKYKKCCGA